MALTVTVTPNLMAETDLLTPSKVNAAANPTIAVTGTLGGLSDGPDEVPAVGEVLTWDGSNYNPAQIGLMPELSKDLRVWRTGTTNVVRMQADFVVGRKITSATSWATPMSLLTFVPDNGGGYLEVALNTANNGAGYLDTGDPVTNTWYCLWVITNGSAASLLISLADGDTSWPTLPTGYTHGAKIGRVFCTDGATGAIRKFVQIDRKIYQDTVTQFTTAAAGTASWTSTDLLSTYAVPNDAREVRGYIGRTTAGNASVKVCPCDDSGVEPAGGDAIGVFLGLGTASTADPLAGVYSAVNFELPLITGTSAKKVAWAASDTGTPTYIMKITGFSI